ncbi:MAG: LptA/OstA family protein [bacterium]
MDRTKFILVTVGLFLFLIYTFAPEICIAAPDKVLRLEEAEHMDWNMRRGILTARGNVRARWGQRHIYADKVYYHEGKQQLVLKGNARLILDGKSQVKGDYIRIDLADDEVETEKIIGEFEPWFLRTAEVKGEIDTHLVAPSASLTTCDLENPHYRIRAGEFHLYPGDRLVGYNVVVSIGRVPVFYLPWMMVDLKHRFSRWKINPGYSSHDGFMLELGYRYLMERDEQPITGTIYTDLREYSGAGIGADVEYDEEEQYAYLYYFRSRRRPLVYDAEKEEEVRSEKEHELRKLKASVDYSFDSVPWRMHGEADWPDYARFNREFQSSLSLRTENERTLQGALIRRGEQSLFRVGGKRTDRLAEETDDFRRSSGYMPRVHYQLFPVNFEFLPSGYYYRFEGVAEKRYENTEGDTYFRPWDMWVQNSLTRSVPWTSWLNQSYRFGYQQKYEEILNDESGAEESLTTGAGIFRLRNSIRYIPGVNLDLTYNLKERFNHRDEVKLNLMGKDRGLESSGRIEHNLDFSASWQPGNSYFHLRGGYDLRRSKTAEILSDSRVYPIRLNFEFPVNNYWKWNQFINYSWQEEKISQLNTEWDFNLSRQFKTGFSWDYNRRSGDDFSQLGHHFNWSPAGDRWRFRSDLLWSRQKDQLEETRFKLYRQLHCWEMRIIYRELKDHDRQLWLTFNLVDYPRRALGVERNIGQNNYDMTEGTWKEIVE